MESGAKDSGGTCYRFVRARSLLSSWLALRPPIFNCRRPAAYAVPLAVCCLFVIGCTRYPASTDGAATAEARMRAQAVGPGGGPPTGTLEYQVGDACPELQVEGWLNGPPPSAAEWKGHVVVIDIWNDLCGMCRVVAPDLLLLQEKYRDRGVIFVGYTGRSKGDAEAYVTNAKVPWPNAYGVSALGTAAPVIYVVGTDGRIAWSDERARLAHNITSLRTDLDSAIARALAE